MCVDGCACLFAAAVQVRCMLVAYKEPPKYSSWMQQWVVRYMLPVILVRLLALLTKSLHICFEPD